MHKTIQQSPRLQEYLFVLSLTLISALYGIFHDWITFQISNEYFAIAKGLGPQSSFFPAVIKLAIKASFWTGTLIGVFFLMANNKHPRLNSLNYKDLYKRVPWIFICSMLGTTIGAAVSIVHRPYFSEGADDLIKNPNSFEMVAHMHWGTYLGGLLGAAWMISQIRTARKKIS